MLGRNHILYVLVLVYIKVIFLSIFIHGLHIAIAPHDSCKNTYDTLNYRSIDILPSILANAH